MADQWTSKQNADAENIISRCGSFSSDAFVSLRSRRSCPPDRTPHKVDRLAENLKDYHSVTDAKLDCSSYHDGDRDNRKQRWNSCFHQYRFVVAIMGGMSVGIMMFHRYSMTVAILSMVNQTHLYLEEHPNKTLQDFLDEGYTPAGEFPWNNEIVGIILGWYMFSYTLPQYLAAKWAAAIGCRFAVPLSLIVCAISTMLTPTACYMGWEWVVACRMLNGIGGSAVLPSMIKLLEDWMRYDELSSGLSTAQFLVATIAAICPLVSGYLTAIHWSVAFYVPGYATLVFCVFWTVLVSNKPHSNWLVSERELGHLCECDMLDEIPVESITEATKKPPEEARPGNACSVPPEDSGLNYKPDSWIQILKLRQFQAYLVIWMISCSGYSCLVFILPAYFRQFLKIPISENGFYCFVIQLGIVVACLWPHQLIRLLLKRNITITKTRLIAQGVCAFMSASTFIYVGTYHQLQLPLLVLNRCFLTPDIIIIGSIMSNFAKSGAASETFAMINTVGNLSITGVSALIGWLLDYTGSSELGWRIIFYNLAGAQIMILLLFALFIDSEPVRFKNKPKEETIEQGVQSATGALRRTQAKATNV